MRVMVYIPQVRTFGRPLMSVMRLQWPELDIIHARGHEGEATDRYERVVNQYREGRRILLAGPWDAMLTVEDDMIVPSDTIGKLLATEADIAYGLYVWRADRRHVWNAYPEVTEKRATPFTTEQAKAAWGRVIDVAGIGNGCTLIRRRVLEAIDFSKRGAGCADWYLSVDAQALGFTQRCDLSVVCGHMTATNDADMEFPMTVGKAGPPRIFWPDPDNENLGQLWRVEYL